MGVRVRFAPGCTRQLAICDARTALWNWFFARQQAGTFVLRFVDTAPAGVDAASSIVADLQWLGLDWDKGPYRASQRLDLYRRCARQLLAEGAAYRCYCAPRPSTGRQPGSITGCSGRCPTLTAAQRASLADQGVPHTIRFKAPLRGHPPFHDLVVPQVEDRIARDVVLVRRDGRPTRHLVDVVDDHHMAITHVIRRRGWLAYTPSHVSLFRALGWEAPRYAHLPEIVRPDRTPRAGRETLAAYRTEGYQAPALVNQLARLGWTPRGRQRLLSLDKLASAFELNRISHSPAVFDAGRLDWFNHRHMRRLDGAAIARLLVPVWRERYGQDDRSAGTALAPRQWQETLALAVRDDLHTPRQAADKVRFAFVDEVVPDREAARVLDQPFACQVLRAFVEGLPGVSPFDSDPIDAFCSALRWELKARLGIRSRDVMYVIRAALTGHMHGPCLVTACQLLGKQRCLERAQRALGER